MPVNYTNTVRGWKRSYVEKYGVSPTVLQDFGDDIAHAMLVMVRDNDVSPQKAYEIVTKGLYSAEELSGNRSKRRGSKRRGSRR